MLTPEAKLHDYIYREKDYGRESKILHEIMGEYGVEPGSRIVEAACSTGYYLKFLSRHFDVTGFDLSDKMLEHARKRVPDGDFFVSDMRDIQCDRQFDAVLCLFSSIGYLDSVEELETTAEQFADLLEPGGVLILEPWVKESNFEVGEPEMLVYRDERIKICRSVVKQRDGRTAVLDFHWLISKRDGKTKHFRDPHELFLFRHRNYLEALDSAGLKPHFRSNGLTSERGLFIGRKT